MIRVVRGRLVDQAVDGLVRPVRTDFAPIDVAGRDLAQAAGPDLEDSLERLGAIPVGGAVLTPAGQLPVTYLIHVAVTSPEEPQTSLSVERALRNGLRRAADWGLESLALPPIGIGPGAEEPEDAARALVEILFDHVDEGQPPLELTIVAGSDFLHDVFDRQIRQASYERGPALDSAGGSAPE